MLIFKERYFLGQSPLRKASTAHLLRQLFELLPAPVGLFKFLFDGLPPCIGGVDAPGVTLRLEGRSHSGMQSSPGVRPQAFFDALRQPVELAPFIEGELFLRAWRPHWRRFIGLDGRGLRDRLDRALPEPVIIAAHVLLQWSPPSKTMVEVTTLLRKARSWLTMRTVPSYRQDGLPASPGSRHPGRWWARPGPGHWTAWLKSLASSRRLRSPPESFFTGAHDLFAREEEILKIAHDMPRSCRS